MAPRKKALSRGSLNVVSEKENIYLRSLSDYQTRVRRRETIRNAKNTAEYDLERKIELEIKMREGSCRLLAAARHPGQSLEAARALLTSNERMSSYMAELQTRKKVPGNGDVGNTKNESKGKLSISDLRFPLMWRDTDHFKNRGDYRRFAVFCLARVGTEIHDTGLLCPVDREWTDITFPDVLIFNNVSPNFELTIEVYSHILEEDLSIASTPRRIRRSIHSSISRTVGKKLVASLRDDVDCSKRPQFDKVAHAVLVLDDTDNNTRTHDLVLANLENKAQALPLFGHFCCRLAVQPDCIDREIYSGILTLDDRLDCWARLKNFYLTIWPLKEMAEDGKEPSMELPINKNTTITWLDSACKELQVMNRFDGSETLNIFKFQTSHDGKEWFDQITGHIRDHSRWKHATVSFQEVLCIENTRNSFINSKRQRSLYDETPLIESFSFDQKNNEVAVKAPPHELRNANHIEQHTLEVPILRSTRPTSSGTRRRFTGIPIKSYWTFSNKNNE